MRKMEVLSGLDPTTHDVTPCAVPASKATVSIDSLWSFNQLETIKYGHLPKGRKWTPCALPASMSGRSAAAAGAPSAAAASFHSADQLRSAASSSDAQSFACSIRVPSEAPTAKARYLFSPFGQITMVYCF